MKVYPPVNSSNENGGFTRDEIVKGIVSLYIDVKCEECGKEMALSNAVAGKFCPKCGGVCS